LKEKKVEKEYEEEDSRNELAHSDFKTGVN
jgi:hypothetical protein